MIEYSTKSLRKKPYLGIEKKSKIQAVIDVNQLLYNKGLFDSFITKTHYSSNIYPLQMTTCWKNTDQNFKHPMVGFLYQT